MRPIERSEIVPIGDYERLRPRFRARVIEEKRTRRVAVGEHVSVVFENRDSVLLQIQEMLRIERITAPKAIDHEIETYNDLIPAEDQLSITVFVEIPDKEQRELSLVELAGLEDTIGLDVDGVVFPATGAPSAGAVRERTTAVHYLKVALSPEAAEAIRRKTARCALVVSHPSYPARAELSRATLSRLAEDLAAS
jgi:Protein of unknown function (DUF3501)